MLPMGRATTRAGVGARLPEVAPDGTFVFEALPPDEDLQIIALCDGWATASPAGSSAGIVTPQIVKLDRPLVETELAMLPTARCEITVVDSKNQPIVDASVTFSPTNPGRTLARSCSGIAKTRWPTFAPSLSAATIKR